MVWVARPAPIVDRVRSAAASPAASCPCSRADWLSGPPSRRRTAHASRYAGLLDRPQLAHWLEAAIAVDSGDQRPAAPTSVRKRQAELAPAARANSRSVGNRACSPPDAG